MAKQGEGDEFEATDAPGPVDSDDGTQPTKVIEPIDPEAQTTEVLGFAAPGAPGFAGTEATGTAPAAAPPERRGLGRAAKIWITVVAIVIGIGALLVVADVIARSIAEQRVADEIAANLPAAVEGDVDVTIGGFSVIAQYLSGTMEHVELSAPELVVQGAPVAVMVVAEGVPVDMESPVSDVSATITVDEDTLNELVTLAGVQTGFTLGDDTVGYVGTVSLLGIPIEYAVTARPIAAGDRILLEPAGVEVASSGATIDVSGLIERLLGDDPLEVCVADRLPEGVEVSGITIEPGTATIDLEARGLMLDAATLSSTGTCS